MDSYVVRIYRRAGRKSRILIGTVEVAGTEKKLGFSNIEEFWEILKRRKLPVVSATPFTEGGDESGGCARLRGIRGGSASNQI